MPNRRLHLLSKSKMFTKSKSQTKQKGPHLKALWQSSSHNHSITENTQNKTQQSNIEHKYFGKCFAKNMTSQRNILLPHDQ